MAARHFIDLRSHTARHMSRELHGVVVSAGLMDRTVKVRVGGQKWHPFLQKYFDAPRHYLVHDPNSSLRSGDVVAISSGWRTSRHKRHVLKHIVKPSGTPISERPPVLSEDQLVASWLQKRRAKDERREQATKQRSGQLVP
jgi:small subunit ribosomal protein S17